LGGSVSSPQASLGPSQHKLDAVLAAIDAHANPATLEICTAAHATVLVTLTLSDPSFTHGGAKRAFRGGRRHGGHRAHQGRRRHGDRGRVVSRHERTSGTDIILNNTTISSGQQVSITAGTITPITDDDQHYVYVMETLTRNPGRS